VAVALDDERRASYGPSELLPRAVQIALVAYAALLGLVEGPAELACLAVLLLAFAAGRFRDYKPGLVEAGLLVYGLAGLWGVAGDHPRGSSEDTFRPLLALAFLIGRVALDGQPDSILRRMAWAFGLAIVLNGAYGYLQRSFGELPLDALLLKNKGSPQLWVPEHVGGYRSVSGLFYNRLKLAHVGIVGLGLLALVLLRSDARTWVRAFALVGLGVLGGAVVLTYARMALAAFAVAAFVTVLVSVRGRIEALLGILAAAAFAGVLSLSDLAKERLEMIGPDLVVRQRILSTALGIVREHPALGVGHGMYRIVAQTANAHGDVSREHLIDAHNLFLQVLAETGLVGFIGFMTALACAVANAVRRVRRDRAETGPRAVMDRLAIFGITAVLVLGLVHFPLHHAPVALVFWTLLGVAGLP
jgi:O-antigen ligase